MSWEIGGGWLCLSMAISQYGWMEPPHKEAIYESPTLVGSNGERYAGLPLEHLAGCWELRHV